MDAIDFPALQSHVLGRGNVLERVGFDLQGRSPLVTHFLHMQQVNQNREKQKVRRTQVAKQPYPFDYNVEYNLKC